MENIEQSVAALRTAAAAALLGDTQRMAQVLTQLTITLLLAPRRLDRLREWYIESNLQNGESPEEKALRLMTVCLFESVVIAAHPGLAVNGTERNFTRTAPPFGRVYSFTFAAGLDEGAVNEEPGTFEVVERFFRMAKQERLRRIARFLASGTVRRVSRPERPPSTRLRLYPR